MRGSSRFASFIICAQKAEKHSVVGGLYGRPDREKLLCVRKSSRAKESGEGWCTIGERKVDMSAR